MLLVLPEADFLAIDRRFDDGGGGVRCFTPVPEIGDDDALRQPLDVLHHGVGQFDGKGRIPQGVELFLNPADGVFGVVLPEQFVVQAPGVRDLLTLPRKAVRRPSARVMTPALPWIRPNFWSGMTLTWSLPLARNWWRHRKRGLAGSGSCSGADAHHSAAWRPAPPSWQSQRLGGPAPNCRPAGPGRQPTPILRRQLPGWRTRKTPRCGRSVARPAGARRENCDRDGSGGRRNGGSRRHLVTQLGDH